MKQQKIINGINVGDRVCARHDGTHPKGWIRGRVMTNDAEKCVIRQDNGLEAIVFGDISGSSFRGWDNVTVTHV